MVIEINLEGCDNKEAVLRTVARVLKFPAFAGLSWDELINCFTMQIDLSETKLVFTDYDDFKKNQPEAYNGLLSILDYTKKNYIGRNFDYEFQH